MADRGKITHALCYRLTQLRPLDPIKSLMTMILKSEKATEYVTRVAFLEKMFIFRSSSGHRSAEVSSHSEEMGCFFGSAVEVCHGKKK